ncbi:MAG TPA: AraC family transcriptional regulator ligand-binding domain-containing protein [Usitatibacter sp.]|nr:AraC family transcriptional regulator ligand-binding domain-containing protein [Usitatibacter sp.]
METNAPRLKLFPSIWASLARSGLAPAEVARHARLPAASFDDAMSLTLEESAAFWRAVRELSGDPAIGLEIARNMDLSRAPPMVLAPYHGRDWRDAIHRIARYKQMCSPERVRVREQGDACIVEVDWIHSSRDRIVIADMMFAALVELGRRGTGKRLVPRRVELERPKADTAAHEAYFGCPVRFGARVNRLVLECADLAIPFISYNRELLEMLSPALEKALADIEKSTSLAERVKWLMKKRLATERPDMAAIAKELAMSARTLQRRLSGESTRFQDLLAHARRELAHQYLVDGQLDMGDVAFLLGFDDQNSFFRAFRQWEGETPARWRDRRIGSSRAGAIHTGRIAVHSTH